VSCKVDLSTVCLLASDLLGVFPDFRGSDDLCDRKVFPCADWPACLNPDNISELALGCLIVNKVVLERFVCLSIFMKTQW
jgi:hypothetical protein